jgi:peptide/nickel transport system substrate-binding protein
LGVGFNNAPNPLEPILYLFLPGSVYNYTHYTDPKVTADITAARATSNLVAQARLLTDAQSRYEAAYLETSLVQLDEVMFLKNGLGGATTSFAYLNEPSLALIGTMK